MRESWYASVYYAAGCTMQPEQQHMSCQTKHMGLDTDKVAINPGIMPMFD